MPNYFRAYPFETLARSEAFRATAAARGGAFDLLFVDEALTVRALPFAEAEVVYDGHDPDWRAFCTETLAFRVPDWERESEEVRAKHALTPRGEQAP